MNGDKKQWIYYNVFVKNVYIGFFTVKSTFFENTRVFYFVVRVTRHSRVGLFSRVWNYSTVSTRRGICAWGLGLRAWDRCHSNGTTLLS